jgi:hypothetical protein
MSAKRGPLQSVSCAGRATEAPDSRQRADALQAHVEKTLSDSYRATYEQSVRTNYENDDNGIVTEDEVQTEMQDRRDTVTCIRLSEKSNQFSSPAEPCRYQPAVLERRLPYIGKTSGLRKRPPRQRRANAMRC